MTEIFGAKFDIDTNDAKKQVKEVMDMIAKVESTGETVTPKIFKAMNDTQVFKGIDPKIITEIQKTFKDQSHIVDKISTVIKNAYTELSKTTNTVTKASKVVTPKIEVPKTVVQQVVQKVSVVVDKEAKPVKTRKVTANDFPIDTTKPYNYRDSTNSAVATKRRDEQLSKRGKQIQVVPEIIEEQTATPVKRKEFFVTPKERDYKLNRGKFYDPHAIESGHIVRPTKEQFATQKTPEKRKELSAFYDAVNKENKLEKIEFEKFLENNPEAKEKHEYKKRQENSRLAIDAANQFKVTPEYNDFLEQQKINKKIQEERRSTVNPNGVNTLPFQAPPKRQPKKSFLERYDSPEWYANEQRQRDINDRLLREKYHPISGNQTMENPTIKNFPIETMVIPSDIKDSKKLSKDSNLPFIKEVETSGYTNKNGKKIAKNNSFKIGNDTLWSLNIQFEDFIKKANDKTRKFDAEQKEAFQKEADKIEKKITDAFDNTLSTETKDKFISNLYSKPTEKGDIPNIYEKENFYNKGKLNDTLRDTMKEKRPDYNLTFDHNEKKDDKDQDTNKNIEKSLKEEEKRNSELNTKEKVEKEMQNNEVIKGIATDPSFLEMVKTDPNQAIKILKLIKQQIKDDNKNTIETEGESYDKIIGNNQDPQYRKGELGNTREYLSQKEENNFKTAAELDEKDKYNADGSDKNTVSSALGNLKETLDNAFTELFNNSTGQVKENIGTFLKEVKKINNLNNREDKTVEENKSQPAHRIAKILTYSDTVDKGIKEHAKKTGVTEEEVRKRAFAQDENGYDTKFKTDYDFSKKMKDTFNLAGGIEKIDTAISAFFGIEDKEITEIFEQIKEIDPKEKKIINETVLRQLTPGAKGMWSGKGFDSSIFNNNIQEVPPEINELLTPKERHQYKKGLGLFSPYGATNLDEGIENANKRLEEPEISEKESNKIKEDLQILKQVQAIRDGTFNIEEKQLKIAEENKNIISKTIALLKEQSQLNTVDSNSKMGEAYKKAQIGLTKDGQVDLDDQIKSQLGEDKLAQIKNISKVQEDAKKKEEKALNDLTSGYDKHTVSVTEAANAEKLKMVVSKGLVGQFGTEEDATDSLTDSLKVHGDGIKRNADGSVYTKAFKAEPNPGGQYRYKEVLTDDNYNDILDENGNKQYVKGKDGKDQKVLSFTQIAGIAKGGKYFEDIEKAESLAKIGKLDTLPKEAQDEYRKSVYATENGNIFHKGAELMESNGVTSLEELSQKFPDKMQEFILTLNKSMDRLDMAGVEKPLAYKNELENFMGWKKKHGLEKVSLSEQTVGFDIGGRKVAGTVDALYQDGSLVDYKRKNKITGELESIQLSLGALGLNLNKDYFKQKGIDSAVKSLNIMQVGSQGAEMHRFDPIPTEQLAQIVKNADEGKTSTLNNTIHPSAFNQKYVRGEDNGGGGGNNPPKPPQNELQVAYLKTLRDIFKTERDIAELRNKVNKETDPDVKKIIEAQIRRKRKDVKELKNINSSTYEDMSDSSKKYVAPFVAGMERNQKGKLLDIKSEGAIATAKQKTIDKQKEQDNLEKEHIKALKLEYKIEEDIAKLQNSKTQAKSEEEIDVINKLVASKNKHLDTIKKIADSKLVGMSKETKLNMGQDVSDLIGSHNRSMEEITSKGQIYEIKNQKAREAGGEKSLLGYTSKYNKSLLSEASLEKKMTDVNLNAPQKAGLQTALNEQRKITHELEQQQVILKGNVIEFYKEGQLSNKINVSSTKGKALLQQMTHATNQQVVALGKIQAQKLKSEGFFGQLIGGFKASLRNLTDYSMAYAVIGQIRMGFQLLITTTKELDKALVDLQIVTGGTRPETAKLLSTYNQLANEMGRTTVEVATASNDWLRAGYQGQEAANLTKSSMELSTLGMIDSASATNYLISSLKGWGLEASSVSSIVDKLTAVDMKAAISAGDKLPEYIVIYR